MNINWSSQTVTALSVIMTIIGTLVGVFGTWYGLRARTQREKAVIITHGLVERLAGLLVGVKASCTNNPAAIQALNDGLGGIKQARQSLQDL